MSDLARVLVPEGDTLRQALEVITRSGRQVALIVDGERRLVGLLTDGDARKALLRGLSLESKVGEAMNPRPVTAGADLGGSAATALMRARAIRHLPLVDAEGRVVDLLVLDDLLAPAPPLPTRAVIMAGGQGRRLQPLTETTPKPLLRVGGTPLLELLIERLRQSGIVDVLVSIHHQAGMIRDQLGDGRRLGVRVDYVEEAEPLGTMGALTLARGRLDAPFLVVNGDILTKCDFRAMWEFHRAQAGAAMTVGVSLHQMDLPYGEFTLRGERVLRVEEKPRKEFPINAGIYVVEPATVDLIPPGRYFDATDLIRLLIDGDRPVAAYTIREYWLDVGRHHDLDKANRDVAEGLLE
jgi:dTDP-glucose pyrophosphorylase